MLNLVELRTFLYYISNGIEMYFESNTSVQACLKRGGRGPVFGRSEGAAGSGAAAARRHYFTPPQIFRLEDMPVYSEKATKFCEISSVDLTVTT